MSAAQDFTLHSGGFLEGLMLSNQFDSEEAVIRNMAFLETLVRDWLQARNYKRALACMDILLELEQGKLRKDGVTPSSLHQLTQALYTISMIEDGIVFDDPETVLSLNFIHDIGEDHAIKPNTLKDILIREGIADDDWLSELLIDYDAISKKYGDKEPQRYDTEYDYYQAMKDRQNASIAKLIDRIHNFATQVKVKGLDKIRKYISSTMVILNDYVNEASVAFPNQEEAYRACQKILETQVQTSRYLVAQDVGKPLPNDEHILKERMPNRGFRLPAGLNPILMNSRRVRDCYQKPYPVRNDTVRRRYKREQPTGPQ